MRDEIRTITKRSYIEEEYQPLCGMDALAAELISGMRTYTNNPHWPDRAPEESEAA